MPVPDYDVLVIGAGPAGAMAALYLAQHGRSVALLDRHKFPRDKTSVGWINARGIKMLEAAEIATKSLTTEPIQEVVLYNADFTKHAKPHFSEPPGFLIERATLDNALSKAVTSAGVKLIAGDAVASIKLKESNVSAELASGKFIVGRMLLLASGANSPLAPGVGVSKPMGTRPVWSAVIDMDHKRKSADGQPSVAIVLGMNRQGSFAQCCLTKQRFALGITWMGERDELAAKFSTLCKSAFDYQLIPVDLAKDAAKMVPSATAGATALDMDSHVGKHTLVIGDAGGFVAAASHEGIYPAMWSGQIAAEVVDTALKSRHTQDALMAFNSEWRLRMADYLRAPNTDIQFLLPLIFSNQTMADRMGGAFFSGENI